MRYAPPLPFVIAVFLALPLACAPADNPQQSRKPELAEIQPLWALFQSGLQAVTADRDQKLKNLDYIYMLNVDKLLKDRAAAGDLDGSLAAKAELDRRGARQATTDEQRKAMPPAQRALRESYDAAWKGYWEEAARSEEALLKKYLAELEGAEKRITTTGDLDKALKVKAERDRLIAEGSKPRPAPITTEVKVAPVPVPEPVKVAPVVGSTVTKIGSGRIPDATRERPFVNSLGMEFVPVAGTQVLFCRWETRVKDYEEHARGKKDGSWTKQEGHEPDHPACGLSWDDANAFCQWLTKKENAGGQLPKGMRYRLPTDEEWSRAVGLAKEDGATPRERSGKNSVDFPWGSEFPPPKAKVGNYADSAWHEKYPKAKWIEGYVDGYATTAPVGSFAPNMSGIYDLGGNVREWCEDPIAPGVGGRVLRGGSWDDGDRLALLSSHRDSFPPDNHYRRSHFGFRCVVGVSER